MKAAMSSPSSSFTSLILKLAGLLLVLGVLVDGLIAAFPPNFTDSEWVATLINEWVGRGNIALVGLALILFGVWAGQYAAGGESRRQQPAKGWLFWALAFSALFGTLFLLMAPIYVRSSQLASAAESREINEAAAAAETQLNNQLEAQRNQVSAVLSNQELLDQLQQQLQSTNELSEQEQTFLQGIQEILQEVEDDPAALDRKVEEAREQGTQEIQEQQQQAIADLTAEMRKSRIRVALNSLLFALGAFWLAGSTLNATRQQARSKRPSR
jgi:CHASE3 domain sensor protein